MNEVARSGRLRRIGWIAAQVLGLGSVVAIAVAALGPRVDDTAGTHQLTYTLSWDSDGVEVEPDGSFTVVTDEGYEVTVTDGTLASYSATVVSCDDARAADTSNDDTETGSSGAVETASGLLADLTGVDDAAANHGQTYDEQVEGPVVETIASSDTKVLGTTTVGTDSYCDAHVAFAQVSAVGADEEELAQFATLELEGTVVAPDGSETPLSIATTLPWATKADLLGETGERLELTATDATIEVRRDLARLFDGVDFDSLSGDELDRALLRSIADATSFVVTAYPASAAS